MDFPHSRHYQRYEYVLQRGFVDDKVVIDVGAGSGYGSNILSDKAKMIYAVDTKIPGYIITPKVLPIKENIYDIVKKVDVCIVIEVFEHMQDPRGFIKKISELCDYAFITTPLAEKTGRTRNQEHIAEYSKEDFDRIVGKEFDILEKMYQKSNLDIVFSAKPNGDTFDVGHVVQMLWARSKNGER